MSDNLTFEEALVDYPHLMHEVTELRSELARHHRDFYEISEICTEVLEHDFTHIASNAVNGLGKIRNIVG